MTIEPDSLSRYMEKSLVKPKSVMPAQAGIQKWVGKNWIPAFVGMTGIGLKMIFYVAC
jgi:hypothetical protein